jgi:hypothetical protein
MTCNGETLLPYSACPITSTAHKVTAAKKARKAYVPGRHIFSKKAVKPT